MAKILLAEDDKDLHNILRSFLTFEHHMVESSFTGEDADEKLSISDYDLLVLDWDLPGKSGIELVNFVRGRGSIVPILMITGKTSIAEKMQGLDTGADDYLTKPFNIQEFGARIRALLRRGAQAATPNNTLTISGISIDTTRHRVTKNGVTVNLLPKEFQLLEFFVRHPNHVFTQEALIAKVWPSDTEATAEALRSTIKRLRKKIDPDAEILKTVHGVGYILEAG
ncbi:MAG TPA: response regulator transcription factor [Drouetiella sp.]